MKQAILSCLKGLSFLVMFLLSCSIKLQAQTDNTQDLAQYLFPEFSKSALKMKIGKDLALMLNYNTVTERMVFEQKGQFFDMVNQETVDTAFLHDRKFVPVGKVFYEVLVNAPVSLFIQHRSNLVTYINKYIVPQRAKVRKMILKTQKNFSSRDYILMI